MRWHFCLAPLVLGACFSDPPAVGEPTSSSGSSDSSASDSTTLISTSVSGSAGPGTAPTSAGPGSSTNSATDVGSGTGPPPDTGGPTGTGGSDSTSTGDPGARVVVDLVQIVCDFDWIEEGTSMEVLCPPFAPGVPTSVFPDPKAPDDHRSIVFAPLPTTTLVGTGMLGPEVEGAGELEFNAVVSCIGEGCDLQFGLAVGGVAYPAMAAGLEGVEVTLPLGELNTGDSVELDVSTVGGASGSLLFLDPVFRTAT